MSTTNVNVNELLCALPYGIQLNITFTGEKWDVENNKLQPMMDDILENGITGSIISSEEYQSNDGLIGTKFEVKEKWRIYNIFIIFDPITKTYSEYIDINVYVIYRGVNPTFEHEEHALSVSLPVSDYSIKFKVEF